MNQFYSNPYTLSEKEGMLTKMKNKQDFASRVQRGVIL